MIKMYAFSSAGDGELFDVFIAFRSSRAQASGGGLMRPRWGSRLAVAGCAAGVSLLAVVAQAAAPAESTRPAAAQPGGAEAAPAGATPATAASRFDIMEY